MDAQVLVLNQNFEPLNVCNTRRALVLVICGKVQNHRLIHTISRTYDCPSVIRLHNLVRRPLPQVRLTRREVFRRDAYTCQYCGQRTNHLTLDHVIPRHRGGRHTWENLVTACTRCNHRKGGRPLEEAGMRLLRVPLCPQSTPYYFLEAWLQRSPEEWWPFLPMHLRPEALAARHGELFEHDRGGIDGSQSTD
jgi:5-methylcytosine-specific restriction endonuclease McrA